MVADRPTPTWQALERLRILHDESWDPDKRMLRIAPGTTPGIELSSLELHVVRETALGAYLDLCDEKIDRARDAIEAVLTHQYNAPAAAWDGTFRVTAEQADPPGQGALEWVHYDPNWRQFLGLILAVCLEDFENVIGPELADRMLAAIKQAVDGEPDGRIPDWYTNPNLIHAWLQAWTGSRIASESMLQAGLARAERLGARLDRFGDVDEYNSPTYDGIDLFAAAVWLAFPVTAEFESRGRQLLRTIGARLGSLYSRQLNAICGPYIRAYGLDLSDYVSLVGLWLAIAGEPTHRVLPPLLDGNTVHVHDLYFLPLFERFADLVLPNIVWSNEIVRTHEQRYDTTVASSHLEPMRMIGAETGRVPEFARDQYVPLSAHAHDSAGNLHWIGVKLGDGTEALDATIVDSSSAQASARSLPDSGEVQLEVVASSAGSLDDESLAVRVITLRFSQSPSSSDMKATANGFVHILNFDAPTVEIRLNIEG